MSWKISKNRSDFDLSIHFSDKKIGNVCITFDIGWVTFDVYDNLQFDCVLVSVFEIC